MVAIGAEGFVGIAHEVTPGTYVAPTKFFPIRSESLQWNNNTNWRRVIRGTVDVIGAVPGDGGVEGDIDMELLADVLPYFLRCARGTLTKTGAAVPYTYAFTPSHNAVPPKTMSVTIVRAGQAFGYTGVIVSSMAFGVDNGMATVTFSLLGRAEASVAVPAAPVYGADAPYGAGNWTIEIPTGTQVFDSDEFSFEVDDSGSLQNRLKNTLGAQFAAYGEREVTMSLTRDFENRTEYDQFKALTAKALRVFLSLGANNSVEFRAPTSIIDSYEVGLDGVGGLVRAGVTYRAVHDATLGAAYQITAVTNENMTV